MDRVLDWLTPGWVGAITVLLVVVHVVVPPTVRATLAVDHAAVRPWTLVTAAYVHESGGQLLQNVAGFAVVGFYGCWLAVRFDDLRWFRRAMTLAVLVVPALVNATSLVVVVALHPDASAVSRGFSGVVAAFGGLLLVRTYRLVRTRYDAGLARLVGAGLIVLVVLSVDARYGAGPSPAVVGSSVLVLLVATAGYGRTHDLTVRTAFGREALPVATTVVGVGVVTGGLAFALFPDGGDLVTGGGVANLVVHAAGLAYGVAAGVTVRHD